MKFRVTMFPGLDVSVIIFIFEINGAYDKITMGKSKSRHKFGG